MDSCASKNVVQWNKFYLKQRCHDSRESNTNGKVVIPFLASEASTEAPVTSIWCHNVIQNIYASFITRDTLFKTASAAAALITPA